MCVFVHMHRKALNQEYVCVDNLSELNMYVVMHMNISICIWHNKLHHSLRQQFLHFPLPIPLSCHQMHMCAQPPAPLYPALPPPPPLLLPPHIGTHTHTHTHIWESGVCVRHSTSRQFVNLHPVQLMIQVNEIQWQVAIKLDKFAL